MKDIEPTTATAPGTVTLHGDAAGAVLELNTGLEVSWDPATAAETARQASQ